MVFSCRIGARLVSLCRPAPEEQALIYRFGTGQQLELVYPDKASAEVGVFSYSEAPLAGGGVTSVSFKRLGVEYRVYSQISRSAPAGPDGQRHPLFEDGIEVRQTGEKPQRHVCDDGGAGFRERVDWLPQTQ